MKFISKERNILTRVLTGYIKLQGVRIPLFKAVYMNDLAFLVDHYLNAVFVSNGVVQERYHPTLSLRTNTLMNSRFV